MNMHGKQTSTIFPKRTKGTAPGKSWKSQVIDLTTSNSADAAPPINLEGYTPSAFTQIGSGALSYTAQDANNINATHCPTASGVISHLLSQPHLIPWEPIRLLHRSTREAHPML